MRLFVVSLVLVMASLAYARPTQHRDPEDREFMAFLRLLDTLPEKVVDRINEVQVVMVNSWKDRQGTLDYFEKYFRLMSGEQRENAMEVVETSMSFFAWFRQLLDDSSENVRNKMQVGVDLITSQRWMRLKEKAKMEELKQLDFKFTESEEAELREMLSKLKVKMAKLRMGSLFTNGGDGAI